MRDNASYCAGVRAREASPGLEERAARVKERGCAAARICASVAAAAVLFGRTRAGYQSRAVRQHDFAATGECAWGNSHTYTRRHAQHRHTRTDTRTDTDTDTDTHKHTHTDTQTHTDTHRHTQGSRAWKRGGSGLGDQDYTGKIESVRAHQMQELAVVLWNHRPRPCVRKALP